MLDAPGSTTTCSSEPCYASGPNGGECPILEHVAPTSVETGTADPAFLATELYRQRRRRDAALGEHSRLFGEPAWDILLDIFIDQFRKRTTSLSGSCIASAVPTTTAMRYVTKLERSGLVQRTRDLTDGRRWLLTLTASGEALMMRVLETQARKSSAP